MKKEKHFLAELSYSLYYPHRGIFVKHDKYPCLVSNSILLLYLELFNSPDMKTITQEKNQPADDFIGSYIKGKLNKFYEKAYKACNHACEFVSFSFITIMKRVLYQQ